MFTLTLVELVYETSFSIWEFEVMIVQNDSKASFKITTKTGHVYIDIS